MVGVAGKSKACYDCRRRRAKCDLRRGTCLRCEKAGIACRGYGKSQIFVNRTLATPYTNAQLAIAELRHASPIETPAPAATWTEMLQRMRAEIQNPARAPQEFRAQTWALLKELYLPRADLMSEVFGDTTPYAWLQKIYTLGESSDALDASLVSFCMIQVYIAGSKSVSSNAALESYNHAVQKLIEGLDDERARNNDETLAAIVVLSTCEIFACSNAQSWCAHAQGISELVRHRISSNYTSPVSQSLCSRLRTICVLLALTQRQPPRLGSAEWRELMCKDTIAVSLDRLIDIVSELPILLAQSKSILHSAGDSVPSGIRNVIQSLLVAFHRLDRFQQLCRSSALEQPYWAVPSKLHNLSDDFFGSKLFPFSLDFESLRMALLLILNAGIMLQVLGTILLLEAMIVAANHRTLVRDIVESYKSNPLDKEENIPSVAALTEPRSEIIISVKVEADKLARFLCQSIEYFHRLEMRTFGPQATCYAQWALRCYFRQTRQDRELNWCINIKNMNGTPGFRCGMDLMLIAPDDTLC